MKRILSIVLSTVILLLLIIAPVTVFARNTHPELFRPAPNAAPDSSQTALLVYDTYAEIPHYFDGLGIGIYNTPPARFASLYYGFPDNETYADEAYAEVAEFGANFAWGFWWDTDETEAYLLDICEKYGLKFIGFANLSAAQFSSTNPTQIEALAEQAVDWIKKVADHPALIGFEILDEPKYTMLDAVAAVREAVEANMPENKFAIANLYSGFKSAGADYDVYVNDYISKAKPKMLYFDDYPLMSDSSELSEHQRNINRYVKSLAMISQAARKNNIPFGGYLQATQFTMSGQLRQPDYIDMKWQSNIQIAFGAKSITWYGYSAQKAVHYDESTFLDGDTYLKDMYGVLTPAWYDAQKVNLGLKKFDQSYIDFTHMGLTPVNMGSYVNLLRNIKLHDSYAGIKSIQTKGMMLNGCFEHEDGRRGVYLYNFSLEKELEAELKLNGQDFELWGENGLEDSGNDRSLDITLGLGEAKFIVFDGEIPPDVEDDDPTESPGDETTKPADNTKPADTDTNQGTDTETPHVPGGTDQNTPPQPNVKENRIIPGDNGTYIEINDKGTPLGVWRWDDVKGDWIYEAYSSVNTPETSDRSDIGLFVFVGFAAVGLGVFVVIREKRYNNA